MSAIYLSEQAIGYPHFREVVNGELVKPHYQQFSPKMRDWELTSLTKEDGYTVTPFSPCVYRAPVSWRAYVEVALPYAFKVVKAFLSK
jgi:hypothetical protein